MRELPEIGVLMTTGMSLEAWEQQGFLDRELGIYGRLADALGGRVVFVSYGGEKEIEFLGGDTRFGVVPKALPALGDFAYSTVAGRVLKPVWRRLWLLKSNQMRGSWVALHPQRTMNLPFVLRCGFEWLQGLELTGKGSRFYKAAVSRVEKHLYRRANAVMLPSATSAQFVETRFDIASERIHVFMNSIDCDTFKPNDGLMRIPGRIVFVGRLDPVKRLELLFQAIAQIPDADLVLVGTEAPNRSGAGPSYREELEKLARELGIKVQFYGRVPNQALPEILNQSRVFVLPSLKEGNPKALMEAMGTGCPCVGARVPGIVDVLEHEQTGLLTDGTAEALAAAIKRMLDDQALATRLGEEASRYAREHFDIQKNIAREAELLRSLMRDPAAP